MIRVLVVDDSPTARTLLVETLRGDPEIEVVGEATNGREAVKLTKSLRPHVVTMDIQMPDMDGFEATKEIMVEAPTPIVVVTGSIEAGEVAVSMRALQAGAVCVLQKPPGPQAPRYLREARQLIDNVKAMSEVKVVARTRTRARPPAALASEGAGRAEVVAIAASTGGPAALHRLLSELPRDFGAPILIVQHMSSGFTPGLAVSLNGASPLRVKVAEAADALSARTVYLAPDDRHLGVSDRAAIVLSAAPPIGGFRPSGSFLFESVARTFGPATLAVVLTGMGEDGIQGLRAVREARGHVLAQDEASSVVFGMPKAAVAAGLADQVLPLEELAGRLTALVGGRDQ